MKLTRFLKGMAILTFLSVIYIHLQVQIYDFAYQAKRKEKDLHRWSDHNGNMIYSILKLKSANHLGVKLLTQDSNLQFRDNNNIIKLETHIPLKKERSVVEPPKIEKKPNVLASIFSLRSQAEAKQ